MQESFFFLNQFWVAFLFMVPMVLIARSVVAGTRYSPILIIVVFGLIMGALLTATGVSAPGLPEFALLGLLSRATVIVLAVSFFAGGQELRRLFGGVKLPPDTSVILSKEDMFFGTTRWQLFFIVRSFFVLVGLDSTIRLLMGFKTGTAIDVYYPLLAYLGLVIAVIFIDPKAIIENKRLYLGKGIMEIVMVTAVLVAANTIAILIKPMVAFPPVFFTMLMSSALGALFYKWRAGPTMRCLLFGGIPVILSANFIIGGSLIGETLKLEGFGPVLAYGFFGQVLWMFGGIALLMLLGKTTQVRNLAPAMAGSLSHAGLTGACTAGDMGEEAQRRAPIMINIPFLGHIFLFTIVAFSLSQDRMLVLPVAICALAGVVISLLAFRVLRRAQGVDKEEVKGLMLFSFGWQLTALFGGFLMLSSMPLARAAMAKSSALSHFGLFAALQGGLFGPEAAALISFVFAMPFLVHPLVFLMFGQGMEKGGEMPRKPVYGLALLGVAGVIIFTLLTSL